MDMLCRSALESKVDGFCPRRHRFVIQLVDERTEEAAIARFKRIFGEDKAAKVVAVCVPGRKVPQVPGTRDGGVWFRMYIPVTA